MVDISTKTGKLQSTLTERILRGDYPKGRKLPSVRELAKSYNVSSMTAKMAMAELRNIGLVDTRRGSGSFVTYSPEEPPHNNKHLNIGLAYLEFYRHHIDAPNASHPSFVQWLSGAQDHFRPELATVIPLCYPKYKLCDPSSPVRLAVDAKRLDGLIVTGWLTPEEADYLNDSRMPFVLVDHYLPERDVATVSWSPVLGFRLIMKHLMDLGHRKIVFLTYSTDPELYQRGTFPYVRAAKTLRNDGFSSENIIVIPNDDPNVMIDYAKYAQLALDKKPDAVIAEDDFTATSLFSECLKLQIEVPEDISIAAIADAWPDGHIMKLTGLNILATQHEAAMIASELLERALQGEDIRRKHIMLSPALIPGQSTGPCRDMVERSNGLLI